MAEAEEVLTDAARHATVFAQELWRRHRVQPDSPPSIRLDDVASRIDLLITAVFGSSYKLRPAQTPPRATLLSMVFRFDRKPRLLQEIPATDGISIWLPPDLGITDSSLAAQLYRTMALQQVVRAQRGSASMVSAHSRPLVSDVYLLLEAHAADRDLADLLPGLASSVDLLRQRALAGRPPLAAFGKSRQTLEQVLRRLLNSRCGESVRGMPLPKTPGQSLDDAQQLIEDLKLLPDDIRERQLGPSPLLKNWWTGELRASAEAPANTQKSGEAEDGNNDPDPSPPRSSRLARRPDIREANEDEDEKQEHDSPLMVQLDEPHPHAEDPFGLQRPTDKDEETSADDFGEMVSELPEARVVSTPGRPKEVLLSDDPPDARSRRELKAVLEEGRGIRYPEWDFRIQAYREAATTVRLLSPQLGSQKWVDDTLATHGAILNAIRRRFEMLRARRVWQRKQVDGDEIDLDAYTEGYADFRAGSPMPEALYQTRRSEDRNLAITLLIDISGSTDSWVSAHRRIIDVEREALLLVCIALEGMGEPYSVQAFSGEGPQAVTLRQIKGFNEPYSNEIALRISALAPEHYTRAGAAIRHATAELMKQPAAHRLLLLLSDGKPNDKDNYEGRYGVEDMRQAVTEASLQGIFPFCLTIDRQAGSYLPRVFGAHQYALLSKPQLLPTVLLDWLKRLVSQ